jgi:CRP-like cAMP-binding protein
MIAFATHPQRNTLRLQLRQNQLLQGMSAAQWAELEPLLMVADYRKGDPLVRQGDEEMEQFFILEGMLKRVVSNPEGREMIHRFAAETEMDTSHAAWRACARRCPLHRRGEQVARGTAAAALGGIPRTSTTDRKSRFEY